MSFASDLKRLCELRKQDMKTVARGSLLQIGTFLIMESPVDTGRFRLNWNFANDRIDRRTTEKTSGNAAEEGQGKLKAALMEFKNGNIFYLTNNLPYAKPLEYGYSVQAPRGMVRRAKIVFEKMVREEVRSTK